MTSKILADTTGGLVEQDLAAGGHAVQPPNPAETKAVVAVVGDAGYASARKHGVAIAGEAGRARVNELGLAYAGAKGCARGGANDFCVVRGGGVAHTGDGGIAITTVDGESIVEGWGVAIALEGGIVSASDGAAIVIGFLGSDGRYHAQVGVIGCDGLKPNTRYTLDGAHNFVEATALSSRVCDGL